MGLKSAITPELGGDAKLDQNTFLLEPVSAENLHNNRNTRNFWCYLEGVGAWSAVGSSAETFTKRHTEEQDESELNAGFMWHTLTRKSLKFGLQAEVTSFVPVDDKLCDMTACSGAKGHWGTDICAVAEGSIFTITKEEVEKLDKDTLHNVEVLNVKQMIT